MQSAMPRRNNDATSGDVLRRGVRQLRMHSIPNAALDAELLLADVKGCSREELLTHPELPITSKQRSQYLDHVARRGRHEPFAYLHGTATFYGLEFQVDPRVLIPRPKTEGLFERALELFRSLHPAPRTIADIGTGSGCLAVLLAKYLPGTAVYATDSSRRALAVARANAKRHGVDGAITFRAGSLFRPLKLLRPDGVVANLPYLPPTFRKDVTTMHLDLTDATAATRFEPETALTDGSDDGSATIRAFLAEAPSAVGTSAVIVCEVNPQHAERVRLEAETQFPHGSVALDTDTAGRQHYLTIQT